MVKAILFDLDATLLPMDQDAFLTAYIGGMAKKMVLRGYNEAELTEAVWFGSYEMIKNDGSRKNREVFWDYFAKRFGQSARADESYFDDFYKNEFSRFKNICGYDPRARRIIDRVCAEGIPAVLATNPVFPEVATLKRLSWAGLSPEQFAHITTYENSSYSKPNPKYYLEIANRIGVAPEDCLMVGNDTSDDMSASAAGMQTYLVTDYLINKSGEDISRYRHGTLAEFEEYLNTIF